MQRVSVFWNPLGWVGNTEGEYGNLPLPPPGPGEEENMTFQPCACLGSWPLWMAPKNLNTRKVRSCGGVLKHEGPSGELVSLS